MPSPRDNSEPSRAKLPRVPGYRIEGVLGRGATGVVYRATQIAVERPVALKILRPELVGTKRAVRRLQREARTAARLAHPSIISAIDMGEVDGVWWYAMELVEGEPLSERIAERGALSEREALRIFSPLCDALQHAFEGGVVHRDIKPANILIDHHGRARLVDLGLAFAEDDPMLTKPGGTLGTPHFISPEQARDPSSADTRSDIWSLGASLFQALCGRPPFQGESVAEILSGVLYQRVPDPRQLAPHLSRGIAMVVRKCLNRDPDRRYQQPDELMRDLERLRERRQPAIRARALDPVARDPAPWREPKALALAGVVATALVLFLGPRLGLFGGGVEVRTVDREPEAWPELDHVARTFASGSLRHHGALLELERIRVPGRFQVELNELKTTVLDDLALSLEAWRTGVGAELSAYLQGHDWSSARELLDEGALRSLTRATGFSRLADLPAGPREEEVARIAELERELEQAFSGARDLAARALSRHYASVIRPRIQQLAAEHRWKDALALARTPALEWLEGARADVRGFDEGALATIERSIAVQRNADQKDLRVDWVQQSSDLIRWIERTQETLRAKLEAGDERGVGNAMREAFRRRLVQQDIERSQVPVGWDERPFDLAERAALDLQEREASLVIRFARQTYEADVRRSTEQCRRRHYRDALERWRVRAEDPLFASVREEVVLRARECELLAGLLDRASAGVLQRDGATYECYVGSILERGTVSAGVDPLRRGFELVTRRRRIPVRLVAPAAGLGTGEVLLRAAEVEGLAGLYGTSLEPDERLLRSLFRFYEGDLREAEAALPIGSSEDPLVDSLEERIRVARDAASAREQAREGDLADALRSIKWRFERSVSGPASQRLEVDIADVLERFEDLLTDKGRDDLRVMQEALERRGATPTLGQAFGLPRSSDVELDGPQDFALRFRFSGEGSGTWVPGGWEAGSAGWVLPRPLDDAEFLDRATAVRLDLVEPFDASERIRLVLDLDPVWTAGVENALLVSIVGYHFVFLDDPSSPRILVDTGSPAEVLTRVRSGEAQGFGTFAGLPSDQRYSIDISLSPSGGKLDHVRVNGVELATRGLYKKPADPPRQILLRSQQPVRLVEARVEGRRRR